MVFVGDRNRDKGEFPMKGGKGFTYELWSVRIQLASILYDATKDGVEYFSGDYVSTIPQDNDEFVNRAQKLPPRAPGIVHPKTAFRIWIFHLIVCLVAWGGLAGCFGGEPPASDVDLLEYNFARDKRE